MKEEQPSQKSPNILEKRIEFGKKETDEQKKYIINGWLNKDPILVHAVGFDYTEQTRFMKKDKVVLDAVTFAYEPFNQQLTYAFDFFNVYGKSEDLQEKINRVYENWLFKHPGYQTAWKKQEGAFQETRIFCILAMKN